MFEDERWLFYKLQARSFLHWGYNYWHALEQERTINPFADGSSDMWPGIPNGDPFMIYPGKDGPIDSIRWEVFGESLQDYAILQTAGISPDDALLEDIETYAEFPKNKDWIAEARTDPASAGIRCSHGTIVHLISHLLPTHLSVQWKEVVKSGCFNQQRRSDDR